MNPPPGPNLCGPPEVLQGALSLEQANEPIFVDNQSIFGYRWLEDFNILIPRDLYNFAGETISTASVACSQDKYTHSLPFGPTPQTFLPTGGSS